MMAKWRRDCWKEREGRNGEREESGETITG